MILAVVHTQRPAPGFASQDVKLSLSYAPPAPWRVLRSNILKASVGVSADLTKVLDTIQPGGPGDGFPLTHREAYEAVGFNTGSIVLQPAHLALGSIRDVATQTALIAAYTAMPSKETVGYAVHVFDMRARACRREYVMFKVGDPRTRGIGMQVTATWDDLVPRLGITTSTMQAAYVGRLVWALEGFDFNTSAAIADLRVRFVKFMMRFGLDVADLQLKRDDGSLEPFTFDGLRHSWDFAHIIAKKGLVSLPTRTSDGRDDHATLEVGRAFMLGDFRQPELADCVCPDYFAQRPTDPDSPNQRQRRAYAAARAAKAAKA